ncbi:MAG: DDE-type integrase/transposase/recombinase [Firmicutes bacterium]|nr:DDE-type integrase/transposase/recombinase [Bacillota bacterium]
MINYNQFKNIKELQNIGVSQVEIAKRLGICRDRVRAWWNKSEADFWSEDRKTNGDMDNYRAFVLDLLKVCPQIRGTNIYLKLQENFPDFSVKMPAFYKFVKQLRVENDLEQFAKRITTARESLPAGEEMQVDFGEFKMRTMYGTWVKVYFVCFVLSYSNFRFIHFEPKPFTTDSAITAHNHAFKYFGGRTKRIMYDLASVFVQSENFGNIIFVKKWEEYVRKIGFSVIYCRPHDPQTKH